MAGSINSVTILGNVGKDPDIRTTKGGDRIANFSVATSESWKDKSTGEKVEKTEWHNVVCFNDNLVGIIEKYVTKGSKVAVQGALQTEKYEKDGIDRYSTKIVISRFKGELTLVSSPDDGERTNGGSRSRGGGGSGGGDYGSARGGSAGATTAHRPAFDADLDDDIPFCTRFGAW